MSNSFYPRLLAALDPVLSRFRPKLMPIEAPEEEPGPYFVCLGAGRHQVPLIRAASDAGYRVIAVDRDSMAPGFELANIRLQSSILKPGHIYRMLQENLGGEPIAGVATRSFAGANVCAAHLSRYYSNAGANPRVLRKFRNKRRFKAGLSGREVSLPRSYAWETMREKWDLLDANWPLIARPSEGHGKIGVHVLNSKAEAQAFLKAHPKDDGEILIEDFVSGNEVTVLGLVHRGRYCPVSISDKITSPKPPLFVEVMHRFPSRVTDETRKRIHRAMLHIVKSTGLKSGPIVAEFIVNSRGTPYLVECVPEAGGEYIADFIAPAATGRDFFADMVSIAVDGAPPNALPFSAPAETQAAPRQSVIIHYLTQRGGVLRDIRIPDHIQRDPRVIHALALKQPGDKLSLQGGNPDRPLVLALRDSPDKAAVLEDLAHQFAEEITIEYEPSVERPLRKTKGKALVSR